MIFLDTNVFLRLLVEQPDAQSEPMRDRAIELFRKVRNGELQATTTEVVLHEICYILTAKTHYALSVEDVISYMRTLLSLDGLWFPAGEKRIYLRALDIWEEHPKILYSDSLVAARAERLNVPLATFDKRLSRLPFLDHWTFDES